jgi:hypothetical protein
MNAITRSLLITMLAIGLVAPTVGESSQKAKIDLDRIGTALPQAKGRAAIRLRRASDGKFEVRVQRLAGDTDYDVLVGAIKVGTVHTSTGGSARIRFVSRPRGKDLLLGFDPRGEAVEIRDRSGDDVLTGNLPETEPEDAARVTCCVPDDAGSECEDRTTDECAAQGGTVMAAASCLPDPCGSTPPAGMAVVCCLPDDAGPECEDRTQADCVAGGGSVVQAASCTPNPCAATPPPPDADVQCCLPNAAGDEIECEDRTPDACAAAGGVNKGAGVCAVDTCADVSAPNPTVRCCESSQHGTIIQCEDLTAAQCAADGGVDRSAGPCAPTSCAGL